MVEGVEREGTAIGHALEVRLHETAPDDSVVQLRARATDQPTAMHAEPAAAAKGASCTCLRLRRSMFLYATVATQRGYASAPIERSVQGRGGTLFQKLAN